MLPEREAARQSEHGVFVTFEESPEDIRRNIASMGWDIARWEAEGRWAFVDASPQPGESPAPAGSFDPGALMARIESAVNRIGAQRVSMDSLGAIFTRFGGAGNLRGEMFRIAWMLRKLGVTAMITAERSTEYGDIGRYGIEEFVAGNVIILRNALENEKRRRTLEILKFRGPSHQKGEFPFSILPGRGIVVIPLSAIEPGQKSSTVRITSGNDTPDRLCGGGLFRDSIILVSGATGTGKTLVTCQFIAGGVRNNERCLYFAFEESREQLFRNAGGRGMVAGAILRATLHDRNEKAVRRLSAIHNIDLAITGALDLSVTLGVLPGHTLSQLNVDAAAIFRLNPRSQTLDYIARDLLAPILCLRPAIDSPCCHHERWDGTGYPRGLKGEEIPLPARIFSVVDVRDALRSDRPYHQAWPVEEVKQHLLAEAGRSFDPVVVRHFLRLLEEGAFD